jgi:hypothetical protein
MKSAQETGEEELQEQTDKAQVAKNRNTKDITNDKTGEMGQEENKITKPKKNVRKRRRRKMRRRITRQKRKNKNNQEEG